MSAFEVVAVIAALTLGATVQSAVGFGAAVVSAPLIALVDVTLLPLVLLPQGLVTNLVVLRRDRAGIHGRTVSRLLVGAVVGTALAVPLLRLSADIRQVLVAVIAAAGVIGLGLRLEPTDARRVTAGILSGIGGLLAGISGPAVLPVVPRDDPRRFRGTLAAYFLATTPFVLAALALSDAPLARGLGLGLLALPSGGLGIVLGHRVARVAKPAHVRIGVLFLAGGAAVGPVVAALR